MVDADLDRLIRNTQSDVIHAENISYSYSECLNEIVAKGLKRKLKPEYPKWEGEYRRVTVMMDKESDKKLKLAYANHIRKCALEYCELPSWSYSRQVNNFLRLGFNLKK